MCIRIRPLCHSAPNVGTHHKLLNNNGRKHSSSDIYHMKQLTEYDGTQLRKNMTAMGKMYISDLMMIIRWDATLYSFDHLNFKGSVEYIQPQPHVLQRI